MKRRTHSILSKIPLVNIVLSITGNSEFRLSSVAMDGGFCEKELKWLSEHPGEVLTRKIQKSLHQK